MVTKNARGTWISHDALPLPPQGHNQNMSYVHSQLAYDDPEFVSIELKTIESDQTHKSISKPRQSRKRPENTHTECLLTKLSNVGSQERPMYIYSVWGHPKQTTHTHGRHTSCAASWDGVSHSMFGEMSNCLICSEYCLISRTFDMYWLSEVEQIAIHPYPCLSERPPHPRQVQGGPWAIKSQSAALREATNKLQCPRAVNTPMEHYPKNGVALGLTMSSHHHAWRGRCTHACWCNPKWYCFVVTTILVRVTMVLLFPVRPFWFS